MKYKCFTQDDIDDILKEHPKMAEEMDELALWMSYQTPEFMKELDEKAKELVKKYTEDNP